MLTSTVKGTKGVVSQLVVNQLLSGPVGSRRGRLDADEHTITVYATLHAFCAAETVVIVSLLSFCSRTGEVSLQRGAAGQIEVHTYWIRSFQQAPACGQSVRLLRVQ